MDICFSHNPEYNSTLYEPEHYTSLQAQSRTFFKVGEIVLQPIRVLTFPVVHTLHAVAPEDFVYSPRRSSQVVQAGEAVWAENLPASQSKQLNADEKLVRPAAHSLPGRWAVCCRSFPRCKAWRRRTGCRSKCS